MPMTVTFQFSDEDAAELIGALSRIADAKRPKRTPMTYKCDCGFESSICANGRCLICGTPVTLRVNEPTIAVRPEA